MPRPSVGFSPDSRLLVSVTNSGVVTIWSSDGSLVTTLESDEAGVVDAAFSPAGRLVGTCDVAGRVKMWDVTTWQVVATFSGRPDPDSSAPQAGRGTRLAFAPNGRRLAVGAWSDLGQVHVWDLGPELSARWEGSILAHNHSVTDLTFSRDGRLLLVIDHCDPIVEGADPEKDVVRLFDAQSLAPIVAQAIPDDIPVAAAISPTGQSLAAAGGAGTVWIWPTGSQHTLTRFPAHANAWDWREGAPQYAIGSLDWAPTGSMIATAGMDPLNQQTPEPPAIPYSGPIEWTIKLWEVHEATQSRI